MFINRVLFFSAVLSMALAPAGAETELSGYIIKQNATGVFAGKENGIARLINGAWIIVEKEDIQKGTLVWVEDKGKNYVWDGTYWAVDGQEKAKIEIVPIANTTFDLSFIPNGDLIQVELGVGLDSNGNFISLNQFMDVKEDNISNATCTLPKDYGTDKFIRVVYLSSGGVVATAVFTPDTTLNHGEDADGVTLTNVPDTNLGVLEFVNLTSGQNLVDNYGGQTILTVSGTPVAQIDYVTAYNGKTLHYTVGGITYSGTFTNGTVELVEVV